ncbi:MAG: ASPIC/UnbV domain-containing protein [Planctomycetota bacterium]|nr:ASPIC/UnbV domain-containing protein [Planctomycetota bacterium]
MTSQSSGPGEEPTQAYRDAWASMSLLAEKNGLSWSGRESNRVFLNLGVGRFSDISGLAGADWLTDGRACARLDWDGDGREDLLLRSRNAPRLRLMLNRWPRPGNWMQFDLVGTQCNRDAIGAQIFVEAGELRLRASVRAGEGFLAASSKRLHFGVGAENRAQRVRVRWPGGSLEEFEDLGSNQRWKLVQGAGQAVPVAAARAEALLASVPDPAQASAAAPTRVPLIASLPLGPLPIPSWGEPARTVADLAGSPVLINFWSPTCASCVDEFDLLKRRKIALDRLGLRIVPMLVEDDGSIAEARALLASYGFDALGGMLDERAKAAFGLVFQETLWDSDDMPLPCSLLLDRGGQLRVIYLGPVRFRELTQDLQTIAALPEDAIQDPRLCGGRVLIPRLRNLDKLAARFAELGLPEAAALYRSRQSDLATRMAR